MIYTTPESYVCMAEDVVIPPLAQMIIYRKNTTLWNPKFDALLQELPIISPQTNQSAHLYVASAIVQPDKGNIPIKVANLYTFLIKLEENKLIAWLTSDFIISGSFDSNPESETFEENINLSTEDLQIESTVCLNQESRL